MSPSATTNPEQQLGGSSAQGQANGAPNATSSNVADGISSAQLEASLANLSAILACLEPRSPNVPLSAPGQPPMPPPQVGLGNVIPALLAPLAPLPSSSSGPEGQPAPASAPGQQPPPPFPGAMPSGVTPAQAILLGRRAAFRPQDTFTLCSQLVQSLQNPENETAKAVFLAERLIAESKDDDAAKGERLLAVRRKRRQEDREVAGMTPDANQRRFSQSHKAQPSAPQLSFPRSLQEPLPEPFSRANLEQVCDAFVRSLGSQGQAGETGGAMQVDQSSLPPAPGGKGVEVHLQRFKSVPGGSEASIVVVLPGAGAGYLVIRFAESDVKEASSEVVSANFRSQREVVEEAALAASSRWHMPSRYPLYREIALQLQSSILQPADKGDSPGDQAVALWKPLLYALHHVAALRSLYDVAPPRLDQLMTGQVPLTANQSVAREVLYWKSCNVKWACSVPAAQALGVGADGAPIDLSTLPGTWSAHYGLCAMNL